MNKNKKSCRNNEFGCDGCVCQKCNRTDCDIPMYNKDACPYWRSISQWVSPTSSGNICKNLTPIAESQQCQTKQTQF